MYEWEEVCFTCTKEIEPDGSFICTTTSKQCKINQLVYSGQIPKRALVSGAKVTNKATCGVKEKPLWTTADGMNKFCDEVMRFPEERITWRK